jgi:hypothetical protein
MTTPPAPEQSRQALPAILLPGVRRPAVPRYLRPAHPALVERAARTWWLAFTAWFAGSTLGQVMRSPAAIAFSYRYTDVEPGAHGPVGLDRLDSWSLPGALAVVLFGLIAVFLGSLVLPMRDGAGWARVLLTVLAVPLAAGLLWQIGRCLFAGPADAGAVAQGLLGLVALGAVPAAVGMMYRREVRSHYRATE